MANNDEESFWEKMQQLIQISVQVTIAAAMINMSADLSDSSDEASSTDSADSADSKTEGNSVFRPWDIDYFDSNSDVESVEVKENHQIYHNVFSFINCLQVKALTMNTALLRQNLNFCLLEKADIWYTEKLTHLFWLDLRNNNNRVVKWDNAFKVRFWDSSDKALTALKTLQYTV